MQPEPGREVDRGALERLLTGLAMLPGDAREGFFGPGSVSWRVNRESAVFLGAGRAALLQIAHPWVAAALHEHSNLLNDALARFHATFRVVYTMVFGTRGQALAASRQLHARHVSVRGVLPGSAGQAWPRGGQYRANQMDALLWVYATLVDSALHAYECVLPVLTEAEREGYYRESRRTAALFGIGGEALPTDWRAFQAYMGKPCPCWAWTTRAGHWARP